MSKFKMEQPIFLSLKEYNLFRSLIPDWAKISQKGLDPTFYGTGTYEGDKKVINRLKDIHKRVFPGDFEEEDFYVYYQENE